MAITLVSGHVEEDNGALFATDGIYEMSFVSQATAGNLIVVIVRCLDTLTISSVDDNGTTIFSSIKEQTDGTTTTRAAIWAGIAAGANAGINITVTLSGADAGTNNTMAIVEFAGNSSDLTAVPQSGTINASVTSHPAGNVTPDAADNVLVGALAGTNTTDTYLMPAGYTTILVHGRHAYGYKIQAAATASNYTPTSGGDVEFSNVVAVAFRGAAAGPPNDAKIIFAAA